MCVSRDREEMREAQRRAGRLSSVKSGWCLAGTAVGLLCVHSLTGVVSFLLFIFFPHL